ncbi:MAG: N4-gp56 family major capsid protein [Eubacteriales bacterium]|nr:N4-gp56 family major capsid protein [Eubacteriales bacterium]
MAELNNTTTLVNGDVFDPQVVSDMINAKVTKKAVMTGYVKVDNTLQGQAGSTVTVPKWGYIGEAKDYKEGDPIDTEKMAFTTASYGIKKIGKGVRLTDEAQLSGYGNPMGTATAQIAMSISEKLDNDRVACLYESHNICDATAGVISYNAIVDGVDMFAEEEESRKVILIHSAQKTQLRKDPDFVAKDKFGGEVMVSGAIGRIAGCDVVVSNKVAKHDAYYKVGGSTAVNSGNLAEVQKTLPFAKEGDMVTKVSTPAYFNPIIKLNNDNETEDDMSAITYFLKRGNLVEHEREVGVADKIVCTAYGMPALTNEAKVVVLRTKATK